MCPTNSTVTSRAVLAIPDAELGSKDARRLRNERAESRQKKSLVLHSVDTVRFSADMTIGTAMDAKFSSAIVRRIS
jgi:hypothetical protein